ncbi:MAG: glycosyltransferase family 39 protein [Deltaproteobacteria bacterium]|nr:glycosyltransferase family 39 protein [Deltaproteobacteria bacterium]
MASAYAPYLGWKLLRGELKPEASFPFGLARPTESITHLTWIGRGVALAFALMCVLGVFAIGRELWGRRVGFAGALAWLVTFPFSYYATTGNVDGPMLAWISWALVFAAKAVRDTLSPKVAITLGALVACVGATKDQGAGCFFLVGMALVLRHLLRGDAHRWWRLEGRWVSPLLAVASLVATYSVVGGLIFSPHRFSKHLDTMLSVGARVGEQIYLRYPVTAHGVWLQTVDLANHLYDAVGGVNLALAFAGVVIALLRDRAALVLAASSAGMFLVLLAPLYSKIQYVLPVALPLCPFVGFALDRIASKTRFSPVVWTGFALLIAWRSFAVIDLAHARINDSRYEAAAWFESQARDGDTVVFFGADSNNTHMPARLRSVGVNYRAEGREVLARVNPEFVLVQPDGADENRRRIEWRVGPHSIRSTYVDDALWADLTGGRTVYVLVAQFQTPRRFPWADRPNLAYPMVNPPVLIFARADRAEGMPPLEPWTTAPQNPPLRRANEPPIHER